MPENMARAAGANSAVLTRGEHVFAHQKNRNGLFLCTIGIEKA